MYFDTIPAALASAGEETKLVAVGPPVPFNQRGLKDKLADVLEVDAERQPYVSIREYFNPPERIVITGSPKFDALVRSAQGHDPEGTRDRLGVERDAAMLVVATRYSAIEPVFEELTRAVEALPGLWLLVKPHQAESPEPYRQVVSRVGAARVEVLGAGENLLELLVASNGLITVDSLASSEALVLGRPVLVVNLLSNLGPLVERGVALGARRGDSIEQRLRSLLYDENVVSELEARRKEYIREFAFGADGGSTERIVEALRGTVILRRNQA